MIILIDNYDSFTYNLLHYFGEIGNEVALFKNDEKKADELIALNPKGIVISPGPRTPNEAGICLDLIKKNKNIPILGVCLGHQSIGQSFGGKVIQSKEIMHGKIDNIKHFGSKLFLGIDKNFKATRYHSLILERKSLPKDLEIIAETKNNIIMGIAHKKYKIFGVQFHPESIGTKFGKTIFKNFIKIVDNGN